MGRLPFLWLFHRDLTWGKQAPIDARIYTAKIADSNSAEPIISFPNRARELRLKPITTT
jgi:hypothetical protein